jgi:4-hydroxy-tetrahydrodipicolinate synthase
MRKHVDLKGILPAMITPFSPESGGVNETALAALTDRLIEAGVGGLVPCGSTGEFQTLSHQERCRVTEVVVNAAKGRVPVIPHTGALSTSEAIELSQYAEGAGASAVMVVPPFYEAPPWSDIVEHYRAIAAAINIPIMLYHIPSAHGYTLSAAQIGELAEIDGIDFLKDSSANLVQLTELMQRYGDRIQVFNGWDTLTFYGLAAGTPAAVWGAANFIPELCVELFDTVFGRGDLVAGRALWERIWPICSFLEEGGYAAKVKAGCDLVGLPAGAPRLPLREVSESDRSRLSELLQRAGVPGVRALAS